MGTEQVELGRGIFSWEREERVSDRYGFVGLYPETVGGEKIKRTSPVGVARVKGTFGTLEAEVLEVRKSGHIGDFFCGVGPPNHLDPDDPRRVTVGDRLVLGVGYLLKDQGYGLAQRYGDTEPMSLEINTLYRLHDQTVVLRFIPEYEP